MMMIIIMFIIMMMMLMIMMYSREEDDDWVTVATLSSHSNTVWDLAWDPAGFLDNDDGGDGDDNHDSNTLWHLLNFL